MKICQESNCVKKHYAKNLCKTHYARFSRHGSAQLPRTKRQKLYDKGMAYCYECKSTKSIKEFPKSRNTNTGLGNVCKYCANQKSTEYYHKNRVKARDYKLRTRYGITAKDFDQMKKVQKGKCLICEKICDLFVDHCHTTLKIRGLLCCKCNITLWRVESLLKSDRFINSLKYLNIDIKTIR